MSALNTNTFEDFIISKYEKISPEKFNEKEFQERRKKIIFTYKLSTSILTIMLAWTAIVIQIPENLYFYYYLIAIPLITQIAMLFMILKRTTKITLNISTKLLLPTLHLVFIFVLNLFSDLKVHEIRHVKISYMFMNLSAVILVAFNEDILVYTNFFFNSFIIYNISKTVTAQINFSVDYFFNFVISICI